MVDIYDNIIVCKDCRKETEKAEVSKEGFHLRAWRCPACHQTWFHPKDMEEFQEFQKLRTKEFKVKLRMVGNSYTISIPREIIEFHEAKIDKIVNLSMDDPQNITLFFSRVTRKVY